jgi:hypothetical protein
MNEVEIKKEIKEHLEKKWMTSLDHQRSTQLLRELMEAIEARRTQ